MSDYRSKSPLRIVTRLRDHACPPSAPANRYGSDKLLSLRQGTAYLSSRFQTDRDELPPEGRAQVNKLVTLFFEPGIGTHLPSHSPMRYEGRRFVCQLGTIHYYHSREHNAPVMQCFELNSPGGGGGARAGLPAKPAGLLEATGDNDGACSWERRIAARFDDLLDRPAAVPRRVAICAVLLVPSATATHTVKDRRRARAHLRGERLLEQIANTCRALCRRPDPNILPAWSMLGESVRVAEQLENDFARAIFAGEAVSHLGRSLSLFSDEARGLDLWRRQRGDLYASPIDPRRFYEETLRVLKAVNQRGEDETWAQCRYFASLSLTCDDLRGDLRCLSIVRSEMIFHFSTILNDYSRRKYEDVAYRYAKFAYFTELSRNFFGLAGDDFPVNPLTIEYQIRMHKASWLSEDLLRTIDEYGHMSFAIVDHLLGDSSDSHANTSSFEQLCTLASQILLGDRTVDEAVHDGSPETG